MDAEEEQGGAEGQKRECRWKEEGKEGIGRSVLKRFSLHSSHFSNKGLNLAEDPAFQVVLEARQVLLAPTFALTEAARYYLLPSSFTSTEWV